MCKHFLLDSEMDNGRHRVIGFAIEIVDAHSLSHKLDTVFEKLKCEAELTVAFDFVLMNLENRSCWYYYAHEKTLMERSKLVATKEDLVKIKNVLSNTDAIEECTKKERANTKKSCKLINITVLLLFSEKFPWVVSTQYCQNHSQRTNLLTV